MIIWAKLGLSIALVLAFSGFFTNANLTASEIAALSEMLSFHPDLSSIPSWASVDRDSQFYGSSWNASLFSDLCQMDGVGFYGVYCVNGHVGGLRVTSHWGKPLTNSPSTSLGLPFLTNIDLPSPTCILTNGVMGFSTYEDSMSAGSLLASLCSVLPVEHVHLNTQQLPVFASPASLITLSGAAASNYAFVAMPNLKQLELFVTGTTDPNVSILCGTSLIELYYQGNNFTQFIELANCLPSLERATFRNSRTDPYSSPSHYFLTSSTLRYLSVITLSSTPDTIEISGSLLEELILVSRGNVTFEVTAPLLKRFSIENWKLPSTFSSYVNLQTFEWIGQPSVQQTVPDMSFAPNLRSFALNAINASNQRANEIWATLPVSIESISLSNVQLLPSQITFPSTWVFLKSLFIQVDAQGTIDESGLRLLHSITEFTLKGPQITSMELFYEFPNIQRLTLNPTAYTEAPLQIPANFFFQLKNLTHLDISGNLAGVIPWFGMEQLQVLRLNGFFTSWPTIQGSASNLREITLVSNVLRMIPTDSSFRAANLMRLETLQLSSHALPAVPLFWTDLPRIEAVDVNYIDESGHVDLMPAEIEAPRLQSLKLVHSLLCGPLPNFAVPTHLFDLHLAGNQLTGAIPPSWETNLSLLTSINLADNWLNGTIPPILFSHHSTRRYSIDLGSNDFTGPTWNMSTGTPTLLNLRSTGIDICIQDPDIRVRIFTYVYCGFDLVPKCSAQCGSFWEACTDGPGCTQQDLVPRVPPQCTSSNTSCPLPHPGVGFECNRGTWIFLGANSGTISLPSSAGTIIVPGNLSTFGVITFSGTNTSIEIEGCLLGIPPQIVIELTSNALPNTTTLIRQLGKNCTTDLSKIPVIVLSPSEECNKVVASSTSTSSSLSVIFSFENQCQKPSAASSSHTTWIIIGSAAGGFVALLTLLIICLRLKSPCFRTLTRTCNLREALAAK